MDSSSKNYQDFEPRIDWLHHPDSHVLSVHLSGFRSNQLKVQVTSTGKLRVSGERKLGSGKWIRFNKEINVPADADTDKISAKLENGVLYVKQPKKTSASSTNPPAQQPKPNDQSQPPPTAEKPKADPQPPVEPPKPPAAKPTTDPPTVRQNPPKSQSEKLKPQASRKQTPTSPKPLEPPQPASEDPTKPPSADPPTVRQNAPESRIEKPRAQANGEEAEDKAKAHTKLKEALEKTREEVEEKGKEEEEGGHGREEKEGGVAEERRRRRRRRKRSEEMVEESGRLRRGEGYKQVIDGMVKELRTNMVTLVLGVAVFVIVYLNVTKKGHVEEEL